MHAHPHGRLLNVLDLSPCAYHRHVKGSRGRRPRRTTASQRLTVGALATLVFGSAVVGAGGAASSAPTADGERQPDRTAFRLRVEDSGRTVLHYRGGVDGRTLPDSSGAGNPGRLITGRGGGVTSASAGRHDRYLRFSGSPCLRRADCPWSLVAVRAGRDPEGTGDAGTASFAFGAWVRLTAEPGRVGMTVMRRGTPSAGEAHWSLDVDDGRVSCRWSDGESSAVLPDDLGRSVALELGRWYALSCARHGSRFSLTVSDPVSALSLGTYAEVAEAVGPDRPRGPITIGAGVDGPVRGGSDRVTAPFHGDLDEVMVRSG
jgi:hypothetical protein